MQQTHTHKTVTGRVEAKMLLSRRRQSEYRLFNPLIQLDLNLKISFDVLAPIAQKS